MAGARDTVNLPDRFNPFGREFRQDPYPAYEFARRRRPLRTLGTLVLASYPEVSAALKSRALSVDLIPQAIARHAAKVGVPDTSQAQRFIRNSLVFTDNPAHVRLRRLMGQVFTPTTLEALVPRIQKTINELLNTVKGEQFDLIATLAQPLPTRVLCNWLGVDASHGPQIAIKISQVRLLLDPGLNSRAQFESALAALAELTAYFVAHKPATSVVPSLQDQLRAARFEGQGLSDEEVVFACVMSFVAGGETTQALLGNVVYQLLSHPGQLQLMRSQPSRYLPAAIEESVRHEAPLQLTKRVAIEATEIEGATVAAGEQILLCIGGANRDPDVFPEPAQFDLTRQGRPHAGFGHGMHVCIGGALARMQARIALQSLLERFPRIELAAREPVWQSRSLILRGLDRLDLHTRARTLQIMVRRDPDASLAPSHLVCFPHAGGSASTFAGWKERMGGEVAVHRVQLPRVAPGQVPPARRDVRALAPELADSISEVRTLTAPFVLYGHSLGALVAFELARELRRRGVRPPAALVVSGRRAPACGLRREPLCMLPRDALLLELRQFKSLPDPVLGNERWFDEIQNGLRAELALSDLYRYVAEAPLDCPIHAFMGSADPILEHDELAAWGKETTKEFQIETVPGAHFLDDAGLLRLQAVIRGLLACARAGAAA
jgi:hypothetical protein